MENLSVIKTKESIKQTFCQLLLKKDYNNLKVTEICEIARINRGTFYYHYYSKEDLVNEIINEYIQSFILAMESTLESNTITQISIKPISSAYNLFYCCKNYAAEIILLFDNGFNKLFKDVLYKQIYSFFSKQFIIQNNIQKKNEELFVEIKTNQLVFGIIYFIKNHSQYSPEEFTEIYTLSTETTTEKVLFIKD